MPRIKEQSKNETNQELVRGVSCEGPPRLTRQRLSFQSSAGLTAFVLARPLAAVTPPILLPSARRGRSIPLLDRTSLCRM